MGVHGHLLLEIENIQGEELKKFQSVFEILEGQGCSEGLNVEIPSGSDIHWTSAYWMLASNTLASPYFLEKA